MYEYIKLSEAIGACRERQIIEGDSITGRRYPTPYEIIDELSDLPTIEVGEDCISKEQVIDAIDGVDWYSVNPVGELVHGAASVEEAWYKAEDIYKAIESLLSDALSGTVVECYARNCAKNKNGKCEEDNIILEFGCGDYKKKG